MLSLRAVLLSSRALHRSAISSCSSSSSSEKDAVSRNKDTLSRNKDTLFKVARATRRAQSYDADKIDEERAKAEFHLQEDDLRDLPRPAALSTLQDQRLRLYYVGDVYNKALRVHGSAAAIWSKRRPLLGIGQKFTEAEKMRMRMHAEAGDSATKGADRAVAIALLCNLCDTTCKFLAAYATGSKSLFAEGIHSLADTCNQMLLYLGIKISTRTADPTFPYGYANARYIVSLISGCGILSFGCGLSVYHGISGLLHPTALEPLTYAFVALSLSLCFQSISLYNAFKEFSLRAKIAGMPIKQYFVASGDPSLKVVLWEDMAAISGVFVALGAVSLSAYFQSPIYDSCGSISIGLLLGGVAIKIIKTNAAHLVGRSLPKRITDDILAQLINDPVIRSVHDVKTTSLGVEKSRFKAEIDFNGREITRRYIKASCDVPALLHAAKSMSEEEYEQFLSEFGEKVIDQTGDEIDRIERELTKHHPEVRHVDLESM